MDVLSDLCELMFFTSLETEERQPILYNVAYLDPGNPDAEPPSNILSDRWSVVPFDTKIAATVSNLVKLAKASDPRSSSLAVWADKDDRLLVWGLVDQGHGVHNFVNRETESGPERPGIFQASILGPGRIAAFDKYWKIAELRGNQIQREFIDVLSGGPIHTTLHPGIVRLQKAVRKQVSPKVYDLRGHWHSSIASYWTAAVCRLLIRIKSYGHGGAVIFCPRKESPGLNIKYPIEYERLRTSLERLSIRKVENTHYSDELFENFIDQDAPEVPTILHLEESVTGTLVQEARRELDGSLWFVSLLSRVDGAIVMDRHLNVRGFGAEITEAREPPEVFLSTTQGATAKGVRKISYQDYGTRHRSMMRYVYRHGGGVGFVVSNDGDVRAMTKRDGDLVVWNNLQLEHNFHTERRRSKTK
jgi:hypothetical protein